LSADNVTWNVCLLQPRAIDNKMMAAAFKSWVEHIADDDHPLVIFHGMLVRFKVSLGQTRVTVLLLENEMVFRFDL
jgi:hypothetical protein